MTVSSYIHIIKCGIHSISTVSTLQSGLTQARAAIITIIRLVAGDGGGSSHRLTSQSHSSCSNFHLTAATLGPAEHDSTQDTLTIISLVTSNLPSIPSTIYEACAAYSHCTQETLSGSVTFQQKTSAGTRPQGKVYGGNYSGKKEKVSQISNRLYL